jgi:hypothetical protein
MKKIIILLVILIFSIGITSAQEIIRLRAYKEFSLAYDTDKDDFKVLSSNKVNMLITLSETTIDIYSGSPTFISFISLIDKKTTEDYRVITYDGVDEDGIKCLVSVFIFSDKELGIVVYYSNIALEYLCRMEG